MLHNIYWYASLSKMFPNEYLRKMALEFNLSQYASINHIQYVNIKCVDMHLNVY